ncbi:MAG: NUDIX domain-containing protein [Actinobacteria bacterium]|nr:NUDIX domain-containing protein [Actinomycetota bacterium]
MERLAVELYPRAIGFVGKEAYRGTFGERPELGPQERRLADTALFVLPSTSPANAAVPWEERLLWFRAFRESLVMVRHAVRALLLDEQHRILLDRRPFVVDPKDTVWATPGGGIEPGESHEQALRRELVEEVALHEFAFGSEVWWREHFFPMASGHGGQREHFYVVRVEGFEAAGTPDVDVVERRWWTVAELSVSDERFAPRRLPELLAALVRDGPPEEPLDVGL